MRTLASVAVAATITIVNLTLLLFPTASSLARDPRDANNQPVQIIDCRKPLACSCNTHSYYAYAPAVVKGQGAIYVFYCSQGGGGAWDFIRSSKSNDGGKTWSKPVIQVMARGNHAGIKSDYAACDPSIVHYKAPDEDRAYFYLFYGSAQTSAAGNQLTCIQVARAESLDGPFQTLMAGHRWGDSTWTLGSTPPPGVPKVIVRTHFDVPGYGAGQPAVIACKNERGQDTLRMWYTDTTAYKSKHALIFMMDSRDPTAWPFPPHWPKPQPAEGLKQYTPREHLSGDPTVLPVETSAYTSTVDVKYDEQENKFLLYSSEQDNATHIKHIAVRSSDDGINWSEPTPVDRGVPSPLYFDGPGVMSDVRGHVHHGEEAESIFVGGGWNTKVQASHPSFVAPDNAGIFRATRDAKD